MGELVRGFTCGACAFACGVAWCGVVAVAARCVAVLEAFLMASSPASLEAGPRSMSSMGWPAM